MNDLTHTDLKPFSENGQILPPRSPRAKLSSRDIKKKNISIHLTRLLLAMMSSAESM